MAADGTGSRTGCSAARRRSAPRAGSNVEDDGYLVTITADVNEDRSDCVIFDAARLADGPVASVRLPERVSSGTHSFWASPTDIAGW